MKKINRRDYLKGMGATAGVIAGTANLDVFAQNDQKTKKDTSKVLVQTGVRKYDLHSTESVKLIFYGLMAIWRNADQHCLIGFHSKDSGKHKHQLMVTAYRREGGGACTRLYPPEMVPPGGKLELEVSRPDVFDGVYFFQPPLTSGRLHENDFRWVPNLEGPAWYDQVLPRKQVHDPVLKVRNGLFYTLMKTLSTFRRQKFDGSSDVLYLGSIAEYVAANIYLETGGQVSLALPSRTIPLPQAANVTYEVHFMNHCLKKGTSTPCDDFKPYHTDKTERSDFYMHFDGIDLPASSELELVVAQGATGSGPEICGGSKASDEAPCSAAGYGGRGGFPIFP